MDGLSSNSQVLSANPAERAKLVQTQMLSIGRTNSVDFMMMKFYVDYEFPETQGYVKGFWKDMLYKTYAEIFHFSTCEWYTRLRVAQFGECF